MAREIQDLGELTRSVRHAYLAVSAAMPLPFATAGIVNSGASPQEEHLMQLRETAFAAVLGELLDYDYYADPADLAVLERGEMPAAENPEG